MCVEFQDSLMRKAVGVQAGAQYQGWFIGSIQGKISEIAVKLIKTVKTSEKKNHCMTLFPILRKNRQWQKYCMAVLHQRQNWRINI